MSSTFKQGREAINPKKADKAKNPKGQKASSPRSPRRRQSRLVLHAQSYRYEDGRLDWYAVVQEPALGDHQWDHVGLGCWGRSAYEALGGVLAEIKECWEDFGKKMPYIEDIIIYPNEIVMPKGIK